MTVCKNNMTRRHIITEHWGKQLISTFKCRVQYCSYKLLLEFLVQIEFYTKWNVGI